MATLNSMTAAALREAAAIQDKIEALGKRMMAILDGEPSKPARAPRKTASGKRTMSPAARARIAAAQRARWAKQEGGTSAPVKKGKRTMSPAARAKIAAAQRARWAKVKGKPAPVVKTKSAKSPKKKGGLTPEGRAKLAAAMKARWAVKRKAAAEPNIR